MIQIKILDESCVSIARRSATLLAHQLSLSESMLDKLAIIVTELATNILKYAKSPGELLLQPIADDGINGIEVLAIDKGPGMTNLSLCLSDGYSSQGTLGAGLGAVRRLSNLFNIYSVPGQGTIVLAQVGSKPLSSAQSIHPLTANVIHLPKKGEQVCGDSYATRQTPSRALFLVADGLGHGPDAAAASQLACQTFSQYKHLPLANIIKEIDNALYKTRGAAIAIAEIDFNEKSLRYAGLGNVTGILYHQNSIRHLMTREGIAGLGYNNLQELVYPWHPEALLIIHSDGLSTLREEYIKRYPGILTRHPAIIAGILYRDFNRGNDDITVMAIRKKNTSQASINGSFECN